MENYDKKILDKTINICYETKYKLSDIAKLIENIGEYKKINIKNNFLDKIKINKIKIKN